MVRCDYCGERVEGLSHNCKFCKGLFCDDHRLPEDHDCSVLEQRKKGNQQHWKEEIESYFGRPNRSEERPKEEPLRNHPSKTMENSTNVSHPLKNWLRKREHHAYDFDGRANYLIKTTLFFAASLIAIAIFYSNAPKLNEIDLWIIEAGGVLILASLFSAIKFGWRFGKEIINILKRQRNWLKYLIILLVIVLLWRAYSHRETVLNPVLDAYNRTNFTLISPLDFGNLSLDKSYLPSQPSSSPKKDSGFRNFVNSFADPKSQIDISELELEINRLINLERTNHGLRALQWDREIVAIAREHSEDMVNRQFFSHDNPEGEGPTERGNRNGYNCVKDYGSYYSYGLAENIALTPIHSNVVGCGSTLTLENLAECIVEGWMESPGHRENILTSSYTKTGIGVAYSENDEAYSTQNFC